MLSFVMSSIEERQIEDHRNYLFTQSNILTNQLISEFQDLHLPNTNTYYTYTVTDFAREIGVRVMVFDKEGTILIDSFDEFDSTKKLVNNELASSLIGFQSSGLYDFPDEGRVLYIAVPIKNGIDVQGSILMISSLESIYDNLQRLLSNLSILAIICVGFTVAMSFVFVEIISRPIEKLTELVNRISNGKYDQKLEVEGNDEIKVLSNSFNSMMIKLDQVDNQRKQFVANVSHELKTPLTAIKLLATSLINDELTEPAIYKEFLGDIDLEVDRLNEIINSLLYLVDIEKKELQLHYTRTQVNFMISKVVYQLKPIADKKTISIEIVAPEKIWASFDKLKLHQCLSNLIENSIKYNKAGRWIIVELINKKNTFIINVKDNGYGIKEESLPFVFDRFYRTDKARNRLSGGTGLGLSIVKQIVHLHQGKIQINSVFNEGTTVTLELPKELG